MDDYEGKKKKWGGEPLALTLSHVMAVLCHAAASLPALCMNGTAVSFMAEKLPLDAKHLNQVSKKKKEMKIISYLTLDQNKFICY